MTIRALSIDGGGIRGIIPATILMQLEAETGRHIFELFDVIVGTSTGGILALAATRAQADGRPQPMGDIRSLYLDRGQNIFPLGGVSMFGAPRSLTTAFFGPRTPLPSGASFGDKLRHFMGYQNVAKVTSVTGGSGAQGNARYPATFLEAELQMQLGATVMSEALRPVAVMSCDINRKTPLVFLGGGLSQGVLGDQLMWHVARATSAGPTFFPLITVSDAAGVTHQCADGGLVANDPAQVAYTIAQSLPGAHGPGSVLLVSVGTGDTPGPVPGEGDDVKQLAGTTPWWSLVQPTVVAIQAAPGTLSRDLLTSLLGPKYLRLQPQLAFGAVHAMDDVRPQNTMALRKTAEAYLANNAHVISELAQALAAPQ